MNEKSSNKKAARRTTAVKALLLRDLASDEHEVTEQGGVLLLGLG